MSSRIPLRRTKAVTRPVAGRTENLIATSRTTATKLRSILRSAKSATTSRATAATASSKAKSVSYADSQESVTVTNKRKREVLAEVTDRNCPAGTAKATAKFHQSRQFFQSMATTTTHISNMEPAPVLPCAKDDNASAFLQYHPVFTRPQSTAPTQRNEVSPAHEDSEEDDEEEDCIILCKRRHIAELVQAEDVPPSEGSYIDEEQVAHQLSATEEDDDDMTGLWDDIDAEDIDDPLMVAEYAADICKYWKDTETQYLPDPKYMDNQKSLTWWHRGVLLDWLVQIHIFCPSTAESFFICVNILDRFCSKYPNIPGKRYQLAGMASLLIASKFEEVVSVSASRLVEWADHEYSLDQLLHAERCILDTIGWNLGYSGPMSWLRRASRADGLEIRSRTIAKYLLEVGVFEPRLIPVPPSLMAAAAMYLARLTVDQEDWTHNLIHYTTYQEHELVPVASVMLTYIASVQPPHPNLFEKYASKQYLKASTWIREWTLSRWREGSEIKLADKLNAIKADIYDARIARLEEEQDMYSFMSN